MDQVRRTYYKQSINTVMARIERELGTCYHEAFPLEYNQIEECIEVNRIETLRLALDILETREENLYA